MGVRNLLPLAQLLTRRLALLRKSEFVVFRGIISEEAPTMTQGERDRTDTPRPGDQAKPGTPGTGENTCPACQGRGVVDGQECRNCNGTGIVIEGIGGG
jgi:hypothetical protein